MNSSIGCSLSSVGVVGLVALLLGGAGCSHEPAPCDSPAGALRDVNETSPTYDQCIVRDDYLGEVSAWYYGYAS